MNLVINFCKSQAHADNLQQPSNINENVPILIVALHVRTEQPSATYNVCTSETLPSGTGPGVSQRDPLEHLHVPLCGTAACGILRGMWRSQAFTHSLAEQDLTSLL